MLHDFMMQFSGFFKFNSLIIFYADSQGRKKIPLLKKQKKNKKKYKFPGFKINHCYFLNSLTWMTLSFLCPCFLNFKGPKFAFVCHDMIIITHLLGCWSCSDISCKTVILVLLWDLQYLKRTLSSLGDSSVFRVVIKLLF